MRWAVASIAITLSFAQSLAASAAVIEGIQGKVSLNSGSGFRGITGNGSARPGDRVFASPGGSAEIVYEDGCRVRVEPGTVVKVYAKSPCIGGVDASGFQPHDYLLAGAAVAGGGIAAGVLLLQGHGASP
jgi:hypothetical protein